MRDVSNVFFRAILILIDQILEDNSVDSGHDLPRYSICMRGREGNTVKNTCNNLSVSIMLAHSHPASFGSTQAIDLRRPGWREATEQMIFHSEITNQPTLQYFSLRCTADSEIVSR